MVSEPYIRMHPAVGPGTTHVLKWVSLSQALQGPGRAGAAAADASCRRAPEGSG